MDNFGDLIVTVNVDAASKTAVFSKKNKSNMSFLRHISKFGTDRMSQHIWDTMSSIAVDAYRFTMEELSATLFFMSMAMDRGTKVKKCYFNNNQLSLQLQNSICLLIPKIKYVHWACCTFDQLFFESLRESFEMSGNSVSIESIGVNACKLSEEQQIDYFRCAKYVQKLAIQGEKVTHNSLKVLSDEIYQLKLKKSQSAKIDYISLRACALNDECLEEVSKFAPFIKSLTIDISDKKPYIKGEGISSLSKAIRRAITQPFLLDACLENLSFTFAVEQQLVIDKLKMCLPYMKSVSLNRVGPDLKYELHSYLNYVTEAIRDSGSATRLRTLKVKQEHVVECRKRIEKLVDADGNKFDIKVEAL